MHRNANVGCRHLLGQSCQRIIHFSLHPQSHKLCWLQILWR